MTGVHEKYPRRIPMPVNKELNNKNIYIYIYIHIYYIQKKKKKKEKQCYMHKIIRKRLKEIKEKLS